ncbi:MAG: sigma-70 family RNA polymerase sigma factor, partial [Chloroflexota bacterium]
MTIYEQYRPLLFAIAYRMLGSVMEAEDVVQDTFLRYEAVDQTAVESPKAFLTTIVSRLCLNQLNSARIQREAYMGDWLPEPIVTHHNHDLANPAQRLQAHESISLAFLRLLENLTPLERAVFLLREVFDYSYSEIS